jgi:hypothetical protein
MAGIWSALFLPAALMVGPPALARLGRGAR